MREHRNNAVNRQRLKQSTNQLLTELTLQLKQQGLRQEREPNLDDLASTAPFCCDTLTFEQWLQFVFIPKIQVMIMKESSLPKNIALKPMAEVSFNYLGGASIELINILADIDQLFGAPR